MLSREKCAYSHDCVMAVFFFLGGAHIMKTKSIITIVAAAAVLIMAAAVAAWRPQPPFGHWCRLS